jgi:CRP/FNR family transcriptional regulator, cyclic AMP receptor protein
MPNINPSDGKLWYLKNLDLFAGVPEEEIMEIAERIREKDFGKDEMIYMPSDPLEVIYFVKRGEVRLYHSRDGKRTVFDVLGPGSIFGGVTLEPEESTHFAQATHPTKVCIFPEKEFLAVLQKKPELMMRFIRKMNERIREYEDRLKHRTDTAEEQILGELKKLQDRRSRTLFGRIKNQGVHITHEELAELTGLNRVTVTRTLKKLKEQDKITVTTTGIKVI